MTIETPPTPGGASPLPAIKKDYIDPDLLDALANSDVASHVTERFLVELDDLVRKGLDISELESLLTTILLKSNRTQDEKH